MILDILDQQEKVLDDLLKDALDDSNARRTRDEADPKDRSNLFEKDWEKVRMAKVRLEQYRKCIAKIDRDADLIEKSVQEQLNLKRTYAAMKDAHNSVVLGAAVIGFTLVTIIFTPLAFLTSLYALPIDSVVKHQYQDGDSNVYSGKYIGRIFGAYRC